MSTSMPPPISSLHGHGSTIRSRAAVVAAEVFQASARDIAYVIFRHKWAMLSFFVLVSTGIALYTFTSPNIYQSEAKLLMRIGRENIIVEPTAGAALGLAQNNENQLNSELSILTSDILAEQVVETPDFASTLQPSQAKGFKDAVNALIRKAMNFPSLIIAAISPTPSLPPKEQAVASLKSGLAVEVEKKTNIINARYVARSPEQAQQTLDKLIKCYLERHIKVHASQASPEFFESQAAQLEESLKKKEQERDTFRAHYGIAEITKQKEALIQQVSATEAQRGTAAADASASKARLVALKQALKERPKKQITSETTGMANPTADKLKTSLTDLRLQETDMAARYPSSYRPLVELRERIKQAEEMLGKEKESVTTVTTGVDANYLSLELSTNTEETQLRATEARQEALAATVGDLNKQLSELTSREAEMKRIDRDVEVAEKEYREYREGLQRAKVNAALDIDKVSNVSIIQPATLAPIPVKPQKLRNMTLGIFLGLFGAVFMAFVLEYLDSRLHSPQDVEDKLGLPVLTVLTDKEFQSL